MALVTARLLTFIRFKRLLGDSATATRWLRAQLDGVSEDSSRILSKLLSGCETQAGCEQVRKIGASVMKHVRKMLPDQPLFLLMDEAHLWLQPQYGTYTSNDPKIVTSRSFFSRALFSAQRWFASFSSLWSGTTLSLARVANALSSAFTATHTLDNLFFDYPAIPDDQSVEAVLSKFLKIDIVDELKTSGHLKYLVGRGRITATFLRRLHTNKISTGADAADVLSRIVKEHLKPYPLSSPLLSMYDQWCRVFGVGKFTPGSGGP